jgi:predicted DsbA family dithiol-disulfide isomerase
MKIKIDVVSDVACPWCYVGMKRLQKALDLVPEIQAEVSWQPFQLDPSVPAEGRELKDYYAAKFGGEEQAYRVFENMEYVGRGEGINYDFRKMSRTMNTLPLHVLMLQADAEGFKTVLKARFFKAYFEDATDLSSQENLVLIMEEFGWPSEKTTALLGDNQLRARVKEKIAYFQSRGVTAVPFFIFNDKYGVSGAQSPEVLAGMLTQINSEMAAEVTTETGDSCDLESGNCD